MFINQEGVELEAIGISGVPEKGLGTTILQLLVRERGTIEPIWRLTTASGAKELYPLIMIESFAEDLRIALLEKPLLVESSDMVWCVPETFSRRFYYNSDTPLKQELGGRVRWSDVEGYKGSSVAVGSLDALQELRVWVVTKLRPRVHSFFRRLCVNLIEFKLGKTKMPPEWDRFHDLLEFALDGVDNVMREEYLEYLYYRGAGYMLEGKDRLLGNVYEYRASLVTNPSCTQDGFYKEVASCASDSLEEAKHLFLSENSDDKWSVDDLIELVNSLALLVESKTMVR